MSMVHFLQATINLPEVVISYDVMYAGDSSSLFCLTSVIEAAVTSWSTEVASALSEYFEI